MLSNMDALNECFKEHENHVPFTAEEGGVTTPHSFLEKNHDEHY
jgi:hypothetical protein